MKSLIKKLIPANILLAYHYLIAMSAAIVYGFPSKKMIIIGVTGTKGKTSTINFIWSCLTASGHKTGMISTANIRIGQDEMLNKYHMTMPGRFNIQKLLSKMRSAGCEYCVVEVTSEGLKQHRNTGIYFDIGVFTNLTPEHLQSHEGSFEKYKQAKAKMFASLTSYKKIINGNVIEKIIIANNDDEHAGYYLNFDADKKITFGINGASDITAKDILETGNGVEFVVDNSNFRLNILGKFNVYNAIPAIVIAKHADASDAQIQKGFDDLKSIPGRMEVINNNQSFIVIVDYAHEKQSITKILQTANTMKKPNAKVIILLGAEGGGRDIAKRPIMGELSAKMADYVVVSNVDPYEDDPKQIVEDIALAAEKFGKIRNKDLFVIEDRRTGISKALSLATDNDIVLITGKGAEQSIVIDGKKYPWDDRIVVKEELEKLISL
jgi:UDP-N-acetylmuramoyl-L-alanyl-D-glutamate--2,6-diaminopimelate ligase